MPIDTSTKNRKVLKWCLACLDKFVNPFDSPCLPLASWLELPAQCKARNVVGGAEGERLDSERWRVPGALARKHAGVDDEQVRNVVGAAIGGHHRARGSVLMRHVPPTWDAAGAS
jgi:hypothetical protein